MNRRGSSNYLFITCHSRWAADYHGIRHSTPRRSLEADTLHVPLLKKLYELKLNLKRDRLSPGRTGAETRSARPSQDHIYLHVLILYLSYYRVVEAMC